MPTAYRPEFRPSAGAVRELFAEEVRSLGGRVIDEFEDGINFIGRALVHGDAEIRPGDVVRGGIAVRVCAAEILVHPYTFRVVCTNGAIVAHALGTRRIERIECPDVVLPVYEVARALAEVAEAIHGCAEPESFVSVAAEMRGAADAEADAAIALAEVLSRWPQAATHLVPALFHNYPSDGDRTTFGLMNAVTAVAREVRDPFIRWDLEKLGGECLADYRHSRLTTPLVLERLAESAVRRA